MRRRWFSGLAGQDTNVSGAGGSSYIHGYTTSSSRCQLKDTVIKYYTNGNYGIGVARDTDGSASIKVYPKEI